MAITKETSLLEYLWDIEFDSSQKKQISAFVNDSESLPHLIISDYTLKSKVFKDYSKAFQNQIRGFRPGKLPYYNAVHKLVIKELSEGRAKTYSWTVYKQAVCEWLVVEHSNLFELLNKQKIKKGEDEKGNPKTLIKEVLDSAFNYDIKPKDVKLLYEVWPFERIDEFEDLLKECEAFELAVLNKKELKNIETKLNNLETQIEKLERKLEVHDDEKAVIKSQLKDELNSNSDKLANEIELIQEKHKNLFENQKDSISKTKATLKKELSNAKKTIKKEIIALIDAQSHECSSSFTDKIDGERCELERNLSSSIEKIEAGNNKAILKIEESFKNKLLSIEKEFKKDIASLNRDVDIKTSVSAPHFCINNSTTKEHAFDSKEENITEVDFLERFSKSLSSFNLNLNEHDVIAIHTLLKDNPVIVVNDRRLYDSWVYSLGWTKYLIKFAASIRWSSPNDWQNDLIDLLVKEAPFPVIIEIFNYDIGLVEGYLLPLLTLWKECNYMQNTSKIVLHPTNQVPSEEKLLLSEHAVLLGTQCYKTKLERNLSYNIGVSELRNSKDVTPVSINCFSEWILPVKRLNNRLIKKFIDESNAIFAENRNDIVPPIYNRIPDILSKYDERYFQNEDVFYSFLNAYIYPWLNTRDNEKDSEALET